MNKSSMWLKAVLFLCLGGGATLAQAQDTPAANDSASTQAADAAKQLISRDPLVRQEGAEVLARLAATDWRRLVEGYRMQEKNGRVQLALDWAIYRMGKAEALYAVVRALDSSRAEQAAGYLAALETPQPLHAILPRVNGNTQVKLLEILTRVGDGETLAQVEPYTASYDPKIAAAARQAKDEIERRRAGQPADTHTRPRLVGKGKPPTP